MYGESPYTQTTAEQEVFNIPGSLESKKQRQKITGLEKATFGGQTGYNAPDSLRADFQFVRGVRLPYQKFNRQPILPQA
jgi:hypothetical protein